MPSHSHIALLNRLLHFRMQHSSNDSHACTFQVRNLGGHWVHFRAQNAEEFVRECETRIGVMYDNLQLIHIRSKVSVPTDRALVERFVQTCNRIGHGVCLQATIADDVARRIWGTNGRALAAHMQQKGCFTSPLPTLWVPTMEL